jgi:hypothetical protein
LWSCSPRVKWNRRSSLRACRVRNRAELGPPASGGRVIMCR